ncbi:hypothetical protein R6Q59_020900 [Mikania micrantha]
MHDSMSIDDASHASQRPFISRIGDGFASSDIHRSIGRVLREHLSGPWTTYRKVPQKVVIAMFKRFKTRWNWDKDNEQYIYEGFVNILKKRYRDILLGLRKSSLNYALKAGHYITISDPEVFNIWNTEDWRKKSKSGKDNRNKTDRGGKTSRHTGGSIGYDERRLRLAKYLQQMTKEYGLNFT